MGRGPDSSEQKGRAGRVERIGEMSRESAGELWLGEQEQKETKRRNVEKESDMRIACGARTGQEAEMGSRRTSEPRNLRSRRIPCGCAARMAGFWRQPMFLPNMRGKPTHFFLQAALETCAARDLVLMHILCNFGHNIEEVAACEWKCRAFQWVLSNGKSREVGLTAKSKQSGRPESIGLEL